MAVEKYDPYSLKGPEKNAADDTNLAVSIAAGIGSGLVKIPLGLTSVAAEIYDAVQGEGLSVEDSAVARLEQFLDDSVVGDVVQGLEDKARATAAGKLTEAFVQVGIPATRGAKIAGTIAAKTIKAIKTGKRVSLKNKNISKAAQIANKTGRGAIVASGGAAGAATVYDIEDIGTFGDISSLPTELDRDARKDSADDALRRLDNRAKFLYEGVLISPFAFAAGKVATSLAKKGKKIAFSNSVYERLIDKVFGAPFRPRGKKSQELFEASMKVEGREGSAAIVAKDLLRDTDEVFKEIYDKSIDAATRVKNTDQIVEQMDNLLKSGGDKVVNNQFKFGAFGKKELTDFSKSLNNIGVNKKGRDDLISVLTKARNSFNTVKTQFLQSGNINKDLTNKQLSEFFSNRLKYTLSNDYKIFDNKKLFKINKYAPTKDAKEKVVDLFINYARANKRPFTNRQEAVLEVDQILENVKMDKVTRAPVFRFENKSAFLDAKNIEINMSRALTGEKLTPKDLIKNQKDLKAFKELFGEVKDARKTVVNTMQNLAGISARDEFYTKIANAGKIVFNSERDARTFLPNRPAYTSSRNGMQITSELGEQVYTNPLNGKFTSKEFEDAIKFAEQLPLEGLMKSNLYRYFLAIPKGLAQVAKTVLSPFTHMRNFTSAVAFSLGTGNLFKDPRFILSNFKKSFNTIQPQLLYRNLPEDQAFYRFMLDEGVVNSSSTFQDVQGLLKDIAKGGDVIERVFGKLGKKTTQIFRKAQDLYVAEDDFYKIYNFLSEYDNLINALPKANKTDLAKQAASIVRNTVPNYSYVSDFIKGLRRSPLGNFVSFPAEIIRTSHNIVQQGIKELRDPALRSIGARRLIGFGTATAVIPPTVVEVYRGLYGISREQLGAMKRFLPEWSKESTIVPSRDAEGNYYYTDFSHGFAYDTVINPVQSVITNVGDLQDDEPLIKGMVEGTTRALSRLVEPFVSESIYFEAINDIISRGGVTDTGQRLYNEEEPEGNKYYKSMLHVAEALLPGSVPQFKRIAQAALFGEDPKTGRDLDLSGEIGGFFGFRNIKMDIPQSMDFKITSYNTNLRNSRGLLPRPAGNVKSKDIIDGFIAGNRARFKAQQEMAQDIESMKALGYDDREIAEIFELRNLKRDYNDLIDGVYKPFNVPKGLEEAYIRNAEENDYDNPFDPDTAFTIGDIFNELRSLNLDDEFPDFQQDLALPEPQMAAMPQTPQPVVPPRQQQVIPQTGLTQTETALLSPEEQIIRQRNRT
tara:strand:- start:1505 stop:5284 length:3780 start_codon:yes stop_codon:yes gene_type:complete